MNELSDADFRDIIAIIKKSFNNIARPFCMALLAFILVENQKYFAYPSFVISITVLIFSSSNYAKKLSYYIVLYLFSLIIIQPSFFEIISKFLSYALKY